MVSNRTSGGLLELLETSCRLLELMEIGNDGNRLLDPFPKTRLGMHSGKYAFCSRCWVNSWQCSVTEWLINIKMISNIISC